jgi:hypothetical protein
MLLKEKAIVDSRFVLARAKHEVTDGESVHTFFPSAPFCSDATCCGRIGFLLSGKRFVAFANVPA